MKAEPAKAEQRREEGKEGREGGRVGGAAEQSSRDLDRKKKHIFFLLAARKGRLMFLYNKQSSLSKSKDRGRKHVQEKLGFS